MYDITLIQSFCEEIAAYQQSVQEGSESGRRAGRRRSSGMVHTESKDQAGKRRPLTEAGYQTLIKRARREFSQHPLFAEYQLRDLEIELISQLYHQTTVECEADIFYKDLMILCPGISNDIRVRLSFVKSLLEREIISSGSSLSGYSTFNAIPILEGRFSLNGLFLSKLIGADPIGECCDVLIQKIEISTDPMQAFCAAFSAFVSYSDELVDFARREGFYGRSVERALDRILELMRGYPEEVGINAPKTRYQLTDSELKSLCLVYYYWKEHDRELDLNELASLRSTNRDEFVLKLSEIKKSRLFSLGLLEQDRVLSRCISIEIGKEFMSFLGGFTEENHTEKDYHEIVDSTDLLSQLKTTQRLSDLVLPKDEYDTLETAIKRLKDPVQYDLSKWGLLDASLTDDKRALGGCNILLHGYPGTGKSFAAGVIANELGRELIAINAGQIRDKYYGVTEKNAQEVFILMRRIIDRAEISPVFLLNEGDQIIHCRRSSISQNSDNTENAIQSIFLEQMETFPGILIVTTNLVENLDDAMSRRFHYKLYFGMPDYQSQLRLWKLHLPKSIPGAAEINIDILAQRYCFSGGQIRIVVQNACHSAMCRGKKARLTTADLMRYGDLESIGSFEDRNKRQIGFAV